MLDADVEGHSRFFNSVVTRAFYGHLWIGIDPAPNNDRQHSLAHQRIKSWRSKTDPSRSRVSIGVFGYSTVGSYETDACALNSVLKLSEEVPA
jgi:hypothetical protein